MSAVRVILITVAGPAGHVDVGVRSDATPADLADALGSVIGVSPAATVIEHRSPPRPGVPEGGRALVQSGTAMAEAGVADGDLVLFRPASGGGAGFSWPEVLQRPAEFGASSPAPDAPALSSFTARALPAPAPAPEPAPAEPGPPEHWPSAEPAEPGPSDPWPSAEPAEPGPPEHWPSAEPAEPGPPEHWPSAEASPPDVESPAEITEPDIGQPAAGRRFMTAPRSSQPTAGRHARNRAAAAEPQPEPGQETTQEWPATAPRPADATEPPEQGQPWWHGGQEVNPDDWRG
jgi:hypothetical protein